MEKYITVKEAAEILRLHVMTVKRYINKGRIKAIMFGRKWLIEEGEIKRVLKGTQDGQTNP